MHHLRPRRRHPQRQRKTALLGGAPPHQERPRLLLREHLQRDLPRQPGLEPAGTVQVVVLDAVQTVGALDRDVRHEPLLGARVGAVRLADQPVPPELVLRPQQLGRSSGRGKGLPAGVAKFARYDLVQTVDVLGQDVVELLLGWRRWR